MTATFLIALVLASSAVSAPALAQPASPPGTVTVWGTPIAPEPGASAAAPASTQTVPPAAKPSAFASARATSNATGDYFHDFGELIVRVRSVRWIAEICSEAFPETAEVNARAYQDWLNAHQSFVDEMEGQFEVIEKYWADSSPQARREGFTVEQLKAKVDSNRAGLSQDFHSKSAVAFHRRCEAYPEVLLSPQLDLQESQADYVSSVRLGPAR